MSRRFVAIAVALLALLTSFYFGSPYLAANNIKQAMITGDVDALEDGIDFPKVRESLKAQMSAALTAEMANDPQMKNNPFAGLGAVMMPAIIERAVTTYVTPEGISRLMKGVKPGAIAKAEAEGKIEYKTDYSGLNRFRVHSAKGETGEPGPTMLFEREGLFSWKVVKIELPENFMKRPKP